MNIWWILAILFVTTSMLIAVAVGETVGIIPGIIMGLTWWFWLPVGLIMNWLEAR